MRRFAADVMLLAALLAGCAAPSIPSAPIAGGSPVTGNAAELANAPLPRQKPPAQLAALAHPPASSEAAPAGKEPRPDPRTLVGLNEEGTRHLLGEPTWTEDVPPARYWQYATPSCVLRVFFFMEMNTRHFRVLSYELTSTDDAPDVDEQCFADLLSQAATGRQAAFNSGK